MSNTDFKITVPITNVYRSDDGYTYLEGVASTTDVDSFETKFNKNCQDGFAMDIMDSADTDEPVKLEAEHKGKDLPFLEIGSAQEAIVRSANGGHELYVKMILDVENPVGEYYWNAMTNPDPKLGRPKEFGLSINGGARESHYEYSNELGKNVRVFDRVKLYKIGIVRKPSNSATWVERIVRSCENTEIKENLMSEQNNLEETQVTRNEEVVDTVVDATPENVEAVEETQEVTETVETPVERTEEVVEEVTETVEETVVEEATERTEEITEEVAEEAVERTDTWNVSYLLDGIKNVVDGMAKMESYSYMNWEEAKVNKAKIVLETLNNVLPMMTELLLSDAAPVVTVERTMDTTTMADHVHEDVSDEVTERSEEVVETTENVEETVEREAVVVPVQINVDEQVKDAVAELILRAKQEIDEKLKSAKDEIEELTRSKDALNAEKEELVARVAELEGQPATTPGGQVTEIVQRSVAPNSREEQILRAKAANDRTELIKLLILDRK